MLSLNREKGRQHTSSTLKTLLFPYFFVSCPRASSSVPQFIFTFFADLWRFSQEREVIYVEDCTDKIRMQSNMAEQDKDDKILTGRTGLSSSEEEEKLRGTK